MNNKNIDMIWRYVYRVDMPQELVDKTDLRRHQAIRHRILNKDR